MSIFQGLSVYVLATGMGKNRVELFKNFLFKNCAHLIDENFELAFNFEEVESLDFKYLIIFDENTIKTWENLVNSLGKKQFFLSIKKEMENFESNSKENYMKLRIKVLGSLWLSECLKAKKLVSTENYEIFPYFDNKTLKTNENQKVISEKSFSTQNSEDLFKNVFIDDKNESNSVVRGIKNKDSQKNPDESDEVTNKKLRKIIKEPYLEKEISSNDDSSDSDNDISLYYKKLLSNKKDEKEEKQTFKLNPNSWICAHSSKEQKINHNKKCTDKLESLMSIYENTKDKFRALGYQKAIQALKRCDHTVTSFEEAIKLPGIGKKLAEKIAEIVQTGDLRKLEELNSREDLNAIKLFTTVHGIGPTIALSFVNQGFRTLDDLRNKAHLNRQQIIGLKHYDDLQKRIPREEVAQIEKIVKEAAFKLNSGLIIDTCGSYRRGKATCGDVDILITHPDGCSQKKIFSKLIDFLHSTGFLTDDLVIQDENSDSQRKYLGICKLPFENSLNRRLDIIIVPYDEYACALMYFTGSAHFNRSLRHLAKKMNMSLSEHSLNKNVTRKGNEKINVGERLLTNTEEDIFKYFNLPYRTPQERDF